MRDAYFRQEGHKKKRMEKEDADRKQRRIEGELRQK